MWTCVHSGHLQYGKAKRSRQNCSVCHSKRHANPEILLSHHYITPGLVGKLHLIVFTWFLYTYNILSCCALNSMLPPSFSTTEDTLLWYSGRALCRWRRTHIQAYAHAHTAISLAHRSTWIIIIARSTSHRFNVWMNNILLGLQQIRTVKITTQQTPDFLRDHSYWAEKMTPFLTSHTLPQVIRFKIKAAAAIYSKGGRGVVEKRLPSCTAWKGLLGWISFTEWVIFSLCRMSSLRLRSEMASWKIWSSLTAFSSNMAPVE